MKVPWASFNIKSIPGLPKNKWCSEDGFQIWCATYIRKHYPDVYFHHSANERKGAKIGLLCKLKGQSKGFPDFLILGPSRPFKAIELKTLNNRASKEQFAWLAYFKKIGFHSEIVRTAERFIEVLEIRD